MPPLPRPFPGVTGPGRRARWRRSVLRRMLAAACAAGAVLVGLHEVRPPPAPTATVVVAARAVPAGAVLGPADLAVTTVPAGSRQPGGARRPADVLGRRVGSGLAVGEALTATRLVPRGPADGLRPGRVALHVLLADPAAAGLLDAGRLVAVYPAAGGPALAEGARVLAVDVDVGEDPTVDVGVPPARGLVLELPGESAQAVLSGHGGLEGPPVVNVAALPS
ncbi:SAF domain-containing protein [Phycicoccus flavus]|uniref:SAF domain-containing protein n=1 Tax=Phycicoccus flavus TaxID=2502783 RepID=UPI000FEBE6AF|nr:SAF domain-containing protein [Phycicoccus flavus]NHA67628.1 hypothetical protein [Phycicoccus flavus]